MAPLLPSSLYSAGLPLAALCSVQRETQQPVVPSVAERQRFLMGNMVSAPAEPKKIAMYSRDFYIACSLGGIVACGLTHTMVTPLDVVKCNLQTDPKNYTGIAQGFRKIATEQGFRGLFKGFMPTAIGYSAQGAFKFGLYEYFKK